MRCINILYTGYYFLFIMERHVYKYIECSMLYEIALTLISYCLLILYNVSFADKGV